MEHPEPGVPRLDPQRLAAPLRTERLELRLFRSADRDALFDIYRRPEVVRWLYTDAWTDADADREIDKRLARDRFAAEGDVLALALVEPAGDRLVGDLILALRSEVHRRGEIGFVLHPGAQGRGYASEGAQVLLELGFDAGLHRIIGRCDARNEGSARLMARLGMRREAHLRHEEWVKGEWCDTLIYALLESEWRAGTDQV